MILSVSRKGISGRILPALFALLVGSVSFAASSSTSKARPDSADTLTSRLQNPSSSSVKTSARGGVKFEFTQYATALADNPKLNQSSLTQADLKLDATTESTQSKLDLSAGKYLDLNNSFFYVQELYSSYRWSDNLTFAVGRKLEFWSQVDGDWQLGLWQPKAIVDPIRPLDQGLTGFFVKSEFSNFEFLAFASPIFIPTQSPEITEKNGALVSDWRWYKTPSPSGTVLNKDTRFVYSLSIPELGKLVNNPGAGMRLRYGGRGPGGWASANFARKPINSLFVKYDGKLASTTNGSSADVEVSPVVAYHRLYGADVGWIFENAAVSASFLRDEPEVSKPVNDLDDQGVPKTDWVQQDPGGLKIYAVHGETRSTLGWFKESATFSLDYMKAEQVDTRDIDEAGADRGSFLPYRMDFTNAASAKVAVPSVLWGKRILTSFRYMREFDQKGSLWSLVSQYYPSHNWVASLGVDVLGVDNGNDSNLDGHFLNQFRANDRVFGGLGYVF